MKKYLILFTTLVTTLVGANSYANCYAQEKCADNGRVYLGAVGGVNFLNADKVNGLRPKFNAGYMGALAVGYKYNDFNGEIEVGYRWNKMKKIDQNSNHYSIPSSLKVHADTLSVMANVLYDINLNTCFTPYVGAGIGYARVNISAKHKDISSVSISEKDDKFAYQGIAGVRTRICEATDLGIEYRYFGLANTHVKNNQNVNISVRHFF